MDVDLISFQDESRGEFTNLAPRINGQPLPALLGLSPGFALGFGLFHSKQSATILKQYRNLMLNKNPHTVPLFGFEAGLLQSSGGIICQIHQRSTMGQQSISGRLIGWRKFRGYDEETRLYHLSNYPFRRTEPQFVFLYTQYKAAVQAAYEFILDKQSA